MAASSVVVLSTGSGDGVSLKASQRIICRWHKGWQEGKLLKQTKSRLIIYADRGANFEEDKYLRFVGIVTQDEKNPKEWVSATKGTRLPKGIYFNPKISEFISGGKVPWKKMKLKYPRISPQEAGKGEEYYYYEFNSNGTIAKNHENAWLIVAAGTLRRDEKGILDVDFEDPKKGLKSGIIFRKVGTTTLVSDTVQIDSILRNTRKNLLNKTQK